MPRMVGAPPLRAMAGHTCVRACLFLSGREARVSALEPLKVPWLHYHSGCACMRTYTHHALN